MTSTFAVSTKTNGRMLKNFKALEYEMLFESDRVFLDSSTKNIFESSKKMQLYKWVRDKVIEKREFLEAESIKLINKVWNLKDSVKLLEKDIENLKQETLKINNQIIEITKKLTVTKKTIHFLKIKIEENKKVLYEYIIYLYKKGNYVFKDGEIDNFKAIFFLWDDIWSVLNDLHFKGLMEIAAKRLIDNHRKYVNDLYVKKLALKKAESETKSLRKQLIVKKAIMKQKKAFKEKLITISQWRQKVYEKFIADKKELEKKLRWKEFQERVKFKYAKKELLVKEWCSYVDFSRIDPEKSWLSGKCKKLNSIIYIESKLRGFQTDDAGNILKWPIAPTRWVSTFFHDAGYIKLFWEDHDALDIPATQWTPIRAPADWYVIFVRKPATADYSFVALKHSDWIVTVYGHLSEVNVKEMDLIKMWEEFAKTGWAPWTPWAWVMTTWAHLHFEVWKDKKMRDPLDFLDSSFLSFKNIPSTSKAFRKYKLDFKARKGYEFKWKPSIKRQSRTFKIIWKTEIERQRNFLTKYGVWDFRKWSLWVEEWIDTDIDPTFLMCVWLAETSLGKHLKTPYNIWNVWNTDSGATRDFASPRDWIHAMARTFNNRYLKQYNEIWMLSRYGNHDDSKPIYASSPSNWHNNIVTCMSHIKGKFIPDDYNFRLK